MLEGYNLSFSINSEHYKIRAENETCQASIQIKHNLCDKQTKKNKRKKLKPYRRPPIHKN